MCGIAGIFAPRATRNIAESIGLMMDVVRHRGPDDEGYLLSTANGNEVVACGGTDTLKAVYESRLPYQADDQLSSITRDGFAVALGHRRLSIVDLTAAGHQPMCTMDRRQWIVFNGEIYNHVELRAELEALGHRFISRSDTEVILAAYRQWGTQCLARFNGMFAFILFDCAARRVFAARDRFGVKPLYYRVLLDGAVSFASEIKQFSVLPGWKPQLNAQRAYDFVNWALMDHTDETLFEGVFQLRNGQAVEIDLVTDSSFKAGERLPVYTWYEPRPCVFAGTRQEAADDLRRLLEDSVRLRLRADVPVGSCLSGGLDSSSIVCVMNELLRQQNAHAKQKTFSACTAVEPFDEREYIDEVVRHTTVDAHHVYPQLPDLFDRLDKLTWHQDEPFGSTSIYAQWEVFNTARSNDTKVMLDGQGADELFAGYHTYFGPRYAALIRASRWRELSSEIGAARRLHGYGFSWSLQQLLSVSLPEGLRQPLAEAAGKPALIPAWLDLSKLAATPSNPFLSEDGNRPTTIRELSLSQLTRTNLQMLLHWEDRNSMAHSVESRLPFLDYRLVEYALGLPDELKLAGGVTKRALRDAMSGLLPERIKNRMDKIGFATPEEAWLREQDPSRFRAAMADAVASSAGAINRRAVDYLESVIAGKARFDFVLWRIISLGTWMRVFRVGLA